MIDTTGLIQLLQHAEKNLDFHGTVLLVRDADTIVYKGFGYSAIKHRKPTDKKAAYNIASISKSLTAIGILQLVEAGKLSLQDPLFKFFKNVPADKASITVHQLLSHTSGIGQQYAADGEADREKAWGKILRLPLSDTIGKRFIYSNDNYTLLAIITELITGQAWESYIRNSVLMPLHMNHTFFLSQYTEQEQCKVPKTNGTVPKKQKRDYGAIGASGIFSTATDVAQLGKIMDSGFLLSRKSKELFLGKYTAIKSPWEGTASYYGYGVFVTETATQPVESIWFRGNEEKWGTAILLYWPQNKTTLVVLSNKERLSNGEKSHIFISNAIINNFIKKH